MASRAAARATAAPISPTGLRLFRLYLSYCEGAFLERHISDVQMVFAGRGWRP